MPAALRKPLIIDDQDHEDSKQPMAVAQHRKSHFKPVLVLNADFRPLSHYPLSLWSWQDAVKAIFQERVQVISNYREMINSPSFQMPAPAVIALRNYCRPMRMAAFTRFNVQLRDRNQCVYCGSKDDLTFDHVIPRAKGGETNFENIVIACMPCNQRKQDKTLAEAGMHLPYQPYHPTTHQLLEIGRGFPPPFVMQEWSEYAYWTVPLSHSPPIR